MTMTTMTTLLALPPDLVERDRVRRQALRAGSVRHEGLAVLREATFAGEGLALTWEIPVGGQRLPEGDGALAALAPVAAGLALLHDAGLAHGGITHASVHVHDGRGCLSGWRPGGTREDDIASFATLLDSCLPSASVGAEIAQVIISAGDPDPDARPSMARIAAALERAADVRLPLISPPAHRRARLGEAPPPRSVESGAVRTAARTPSPAHGRGRHAARRAAAGTPSASLTSLRVSWRWGVAIVGTALAAFLGLSALGSTGSAQEVCPAASQSVAVG